ESRLHRRTCFEFNRQILTNEEGHLGIGQHQEWINALGYGSGKGYDESGTEEPANSWAGGIGGMSWKFSFSQSRFKGLSSKHAQ
ncbi:hypothetical protein PIB30_110941, partial [Stylosanthes scabra]|nr:hypothetical protein [Stylosanthes scabra]